ETIVEEADINSTFTPAPKSEAPKAEAPKAEAPKAEAPKAEAPKAAATSAGGTPINAPLPGTILKVPAKQGDSIKKGAVLCILEA
ncbi:MAG: acetyl-CoA carboxylase biotin carboxyl carrier protein subunit, partial [Clostridia bacterium]